MSTLTATDPSPKVVNAAFLDRIERGFVKEAQDAVTEYIRIRMREDGFWRRIIPPTQVTNDELDRQVDTDKPVIIVDKEPESPAAISVPFAQLPLNRYIRGPRFRVMFDRIMTPRFVKDIDELRTYDMDIRQILSDNSIKDMAAEEDGKAILAVNAALVGPGVPNPDTGVVQHKVFGGGVTRDNLAESMKIMPSTPNHLNPATCIINNVTIWDVVKFGRDEVGGDMAQELFQNGFAEREIMGVRWIVTIKRDLVPDGTVFQFAEPKFLGKFFVLEDTTMYIKREAFMLEFFAYQTLGSAIANTAALARADFV